jgi:hypothetical protein
MVDDDECEAVDGMRIDRGNRSTPRKTDQFHFDNSKSHIA